MLRYIESYGFRGFIKLVIDTVNTRIFFRRCRIIRRPYYIRGRRHIKFGGNFTSGVGLRLDALEKPRNKNFVIEFGDNVQVNDYVHIAGINSIRIGSNVLIASKVFISDHNHGNYKGNMEHSSPLEAPDQRALSIGSIVIEDNVWLGEFVAVLPGVTIGKGAIIGSMSVVTKDIPPFCIAAGTPARVIKTFDFHSQKWEGV